jgi:hypothetical protein
MDLRHRLRGWTFRLLNDLARFLARDLDFLGISRPD